MTFATSRNDPAIAGVVANVFGAGVASVVQVKMQKSLTAPQLREIIAAMHRKAKELGIGKYYAVLYTTADMPATLDVSTLPEGSIIVKREGVYRLLDDLGKSPILQQLEAKEQK